VKLACPATSVTFPSVVVESLKTTVPLGKGAPKTDQNAPSRALIPFSSTVVEQAIETAALMLGSDKSATCRL
jgi:hypothetical protein